MLVTITTSRRPELFRRTIESFAKNAKDWRMAVSGVALFDDASTAEQRRYMLEALADNRIENGHFQTTITDEPVGHAQMMQIVHKYVMENTTNGDVLFAHCEDDWTLTSPGCPFLAAIDVMLTNPRLGQCCFGVARNNDWKVKRTRTGTSYAIRPNKESTDPSPAFTLNPSIMRVQAWADVGAFENIEGFEASYGQRWQEKGWLTAELVPHFLEHLGEGRSAYDLNGKKR